MHDHSQTIEVLEMCANYLHEVRTGSDFECECWEIAEKAENEIKRLKAEQAKNQSECHTQ